MNTWGKSFRIECPKDTGAGDRHTAVEVRAPVDVLTFARLGKALRKCPCGAELVLRGEAGADVIDLADRKAAPR